MPKYKFHFSAEESEAIVIEADSLEVAQEQAWNQFLAAIETRRVL